MKEVISLSRIIARTQLPAIEIEVNVTMEKLYFMKGALEGEANR